MAIKKENRDYKTENAKRATQIKRYNLVLKNEEAMIFDGILGLLNCTNASQLARKIITGELIISERD